jgi:hypothetical protein
LRKFALFARPAARNVKKLKGSGKTAPLQRNPLIQAVVVVTARGVDACTGLPLELDATPIAIAATTPVPISTQLVELNCACLTPAGLPAASGPTSAAKTVEEIKVVARATAISLRIIPLVAFLFSGTKHKKASGTIQSADSHGTSSAGW